MRASRKECLSEAFDVSTDHDELLSRVKEDEMSLVASRLTMRVATPDSLAAIIIGGVVQMLAEGTCG